MTLPPLVTRLRRLMLTIAKKLTWLPPLVARVALGAVFIETGWGKLHDLPGTTENFVGWHIPLPHFNAVLASGTEFFGGCLLVAGLFTRLAAVPLMITMAVAIAAAKWAKLEGLTDFFGLDEFAYLMLFLWLAVAGPGAVSLDRLLARWLKVDDGRSEPTPQS